VSSSANILIVDDDPRICQLLSKYLTREGYPVKTACDGADMHRHIAVEMPDLLILDVKLPDGDGFSLARELRTQSDIPIIMLTGKADSIDKVVGLELGADDYVTKPFDNRELLARIRSVLRRTSNKHTTSTSTHRGHKIASFEGWQLDLTSQELTSAAGERVHLTSYEYKLLVGLVARPNHALNREQILDLIADRDWTPYDRSIDVLVGKLRKKIEEEPKQPRLIKTVRGTGYKFTTNIEYS
jgi:two-component system OmpR family response regulator